MSVPFKELAGSPVEYYGLRGVRAQRRILCAWNDRSSMLNELLGSSYSFGNIRGAIYPGRSWFTVSDVKVEPFESCPDNQGPFELVTQRINSYSGQHALLTVDYALVPSAPGVELLAEPEAGTWLSYRATSQVEEVSLPSDSLCWEDQGAAPVPGETVPLLRVPIVSHHVAWHRVVQPPWAAIRAALGSINSQPFLGAPPETLLFDSAGAERQFVNFDDLQQPQYAWRIRYVFRERALHSAAGAACGWNHAYRAAPEAAPGFDRLLTTLGVPLYRTADFSRLFHSAARNG